MQAWNLNRLTGFHVIEAGIQMVLCPTCMGHRKNIITFLLPPHFKKECIEFLLREIHVQKIVRNVSPGPIYHYAVTHQCSGGNPAPIGGHPAPSYPAPTLTPPASPPPASPPPSYNLSEQVAITPPGENDEHAFLRPDYSNVAQWRTSGADQRRTSGADQRRTSGDDQSSASATNTRPPDSGRKQPPPVPPRDIPRPMAQPYLHCRTEVHHHHRPTAISGRSRIFATPYSISHRVFIDSNGHVKRESHLLGSDSGEFRLGPPIGTSPLLTPPRSTPPCKQKGDPPLYHNLSSSGSSSEATCPSLTRRSTVSQGSRQTSVTSLQRRSQQSSLRRRSDSEVSHGRIERGATAIHPCFSFPTSRHSQEVEPSSYSKLSATTDISTGVAWRSDSHDYQNYSPRVERSPSPCMCTDEISDIALEAIFRVGALPTPPRALPPSTTNRNEDHPTNCTVGERSDECPDYFNIQSMTAFSAPSTAADYQNKGSFVKPPIPTPRRRFTMETEVILVPTAAQTLSIIERVSPDSSQSNASVSHSPDLPDNPTTSFNASPPDSHSCNTLPKPVPPCRHFSNSVENSPVLPRKLNPMMSRSYSSLLNPQSNN